MSDELDRIRSKIREQQEQLPSQWMLTEYHNHLKRTGAESRGTQANYLKVLRKILYVEDFDIQEIKEMSEKQLKQLNRDMADNVQNSYYRKSSGEDGKRRKREYWTAWKKLLEVQGWQTDKYADYMPKIKFSEKKDKEPLTRPEKIPTRNQMKKFLKKLGQRSRPHIALRNQALALLLWDKGPRIGEAQNIQLKDVSVKDQQLKIRVPGNKKSDNRKVPVYQGRKTLKDWIQRHPYRGNQEAYLFPVVQKNNPENTLDRGSLGKKYHQSAIGLDFGTKGEPFHIFRKAMVSSHVVNEWATWEQVCKWHGKKPDATKPDYLKLLMEDVNQSVAENMGVKEEVTDTNNENSMLGKPLLPIDCPSCDHLNRCYHETCQSCGTTLPEHTMPDNLEDGQEKAKERARGEADKLWDKMEEIEQKMDERGEK